MKNLIHTLFFFLVVTQICSAQWYQQNPLLQQNTLNDVVLIDDNNGWAVGENGTIIKTTNGGINWSTQVSGTAYSLRGLCFANASVGWAVGENGIILKTTNGGNSWIQQTSGTSDGLNDLSFATATIGTAVGDNGTILRTTDAGITWTPQTGGGIIALEGVCFVNSNTGWAVGYDKILGTTNGGTTWSLQLDGIGGPDGALHSIYFVDENTGWAVGWRPWVGLAFKTTDGGNTWTEPTPYEIWCSLYDVYFNDLNNGYAVGSSGVILRTLDGGLNWIHQASGTSQVLQAISFNNTNAGIVVGYNGTIKHTTNGGSIWISPPNGSTNNFSDVYFSDANNGIVIGDAGSILKTGDGGTTWIPIPTWTTNGFIKMCFIDANKGWVIEGGDTCIVFHTTDGGTTWTAQKIFPLSTLNDICFINADTGFVVGSIRDSIGYIQHSIILKTTNGGLSWDQQISDTIKTLTKVNFIDSNNGWIVGSVSLMETDQARELKKNVWSASSIYRTTDGGTSWYQQLEIEDITLGEISFTDLNNGIAIGTKWFGGWYEGGVIAKTIDGGENWTIQIFTGPEPCEDLIFHDLFFVTDNIAVILGNPCSLGIRFYWTTDGGTNWTCRPSGIDPSMNRLFFTDELNGWAVGGNGVILHTTNGGVPVELASFTATTNGKEVILNWSTATELNNLGFEIQRSSEGVEFFTVGFVNGHGTTTEQQNYSYADRNLDNGKYFYRLKQVDFDGSYKYSELVELEFRSINSYLLEQNYPNPFNPTTTIKYSIPKAQKVRLTLFNLLGEEVATLVNEEKLAGNYTVEFNAVNLPSGVYFYQLESGEFISVKKMILIK